MIGSCDNCDRQNVPVSNGESCGCETTQCFICQGDVADPYGEFEDRIERVADWHGSHAADAYARWVHLSGLRAKGNVPLASITADDALRDYVRHAGIAQRMWGSLS